MQKKGSLKLLRGAAAACAVLTTVSIGAAGMAAYWEPTINQFLGTSSTKVVTSEESTGEGLYTYENKDIKTSDDLVKWHKDLAVREQREGSVLLKNNGALPLAEGAKVTLLGNRSVVSVYGGQIGSSPETSQNVSLEAALTDRLFEVNPVALSAYNKYLGGDGSSGARENGPTILNNSFNPVENLNAAIAINEPSVAQLVEKEAGFENSFSQYGDAAIVVIGRPSSEAADFAPGAAGLKNPSEFEAGANILGLSINEKAIIDYACEKFDKVVVLVNSDSAMELDYLKNKTEVDSVLWIGAVGNYGFYGVADLLKGVVSPSGHLPDTYAVNSANSPAMVNYGVFKYSNLSAISDDKSYIDYRAIAYLDEKEGIYTGYRYYETRYEDAVLGRYNAASAVGSSTDSGWSYDSEVSYAFGYGLSYTTFKQEILGFTERLGKISVDVKVTNTGDRKGKDVVQVYVQTPYTDYDRTNHVEKASIQLAGFEKTSELDPNGEETVTVTFDKKYIASYDYVNARTYILDAGDYYLSIGNGAHEAINNVLKAKDPSLTVDGDASMTRTWHQDALDDKAYATSGNGTEITNRFDDMNANYWTGDKSKLYEGQLSRSDWQTTWPTANEGLAASDAMIAELRNKVYTTEGVSTAETKWGQNTGLTIGMLKGAKFDDERWAELLSTMTLDEAVYFFCNGKDATQTISSIGLDAQHVQDGPLGFCYAPLGKYNDGKDGDPTAMKSDDANKDYNIYDSVTEPVIAAAFNKELVKEQGELFGTDSLWCNSFILWGPGLNTHRTPYNGRNHEYYSEDPMLTNYLGAAMTEGAFKYGLILAPKHFAFNDQESNRTGVAVFMNEQRARENELRAFQGAFEDAGCMGTMTAFNRAGLRYASAHKGLMTDVLKNEWGFKGYAVTDMINGEYYMRADTALMAGTTILDTTSNSDSEALINAIKNDAAAQNMLKDAMHANLWTIANSNALQGIDNLSKVIAVTPWWKALLVSLEAIFGVLTGAAIVGYCLVLYFKKDDKKETA